MIVTNPNRTDALVDALTTLWEASVRATHHFLSEDDIQKLVPHVKTGLAEIETLIVAYDGPRPCAFLGLRGDKIEMLFVCPDSFGQGIGRAQVELAISQHGAHFVDVNEQNPRAEGFYQHLGFEEFERRTTDDQGNPFPILKMKRTNQK